MGRRPREEAEIGNDSFLDVVANMVGIMIILVMVAGLRAEQDPFREEAAADAATAEPDSELQQAAALEDDVMHLAEQMQSVATEAQLRTAERNAIAYQVALGKRLIDEQRQKLDGKRRADYDLQCAAAAASAEVSRLDSALASVSKAKRTAVKVTSYPTPLARTVTGKELHFQLHGGRVAFVPFDEVIEQKLQSELRRQVSRSRSTDEVTDTFGPLHGFRVRYTLERVDNYVRVNKLDMIPVSPSIGEPLEVALSEGSEFYSLVTRSRPDTTAVTLWTYPDSFALYRRLKEELYQAGFTVAGRPLPEGQYIGASPTGSKSAAQ